MNAALPSPIAIRDFAKALGWTQVDRARADRLYVLNSPDSPRRQIVLAMDDNAPDYWEAAEIALRKLADIRRMTFAQILMAVETVRSDVVQCVIVPEQNRTTLPLSFARSAVKALEQLISAAACGVVKPRLHHPRLSLAEAEKVLDSALFGQTERGSYVFNVALPLGYEGLSGAPEQVPFVRKTTLRAQESLSLLVDAIESDQLDELVDSQKKAEKPILSSNICDAAALLLSESLRNSVEMKFNWGGGILALEARPQQSVRLQHTYLARIEEISSEFRASEGDKEDTFVGTVETMAGDMGPNKRRSGEVILELLLPEIGSVRARVNLDEEQYAQADEAHMNDGHYIQISGKLRAGRQPRLLTDIASFTLIRPVQA